MPPLPCLLARYGELLSQLLRGPVLGFQGGFPGLLGLDILRPPIDAGLPCVAVNVGDPLLSAVSGLCALAVGIMCSERLGPLRALLEGVPDARPV